MVLAHMAPKGPTQNSFGYILAHFCDLWFFRFLCWETMKNKKIQQRAAAKIDFQPWNISQSITTLIKTENRKSIFFLFLDIPTFKHPKNWSFWRVENWGKKSFELGRSHEKIFCSNFFKIPSYIEKFHFWGPSIFFNFSCPC